MRGFFLWKMLQPPALAQVVVQAGGALWTSASRNDPAAYLHVGAVVALVL